MDWWAIKKSIEVRLFSSGGNFAAPGIMVFNEEGSFTSKPLTNINRLTLQERGHADRFGVGLRSYSVTRL